MRPYVLRLLHANPLSTPNPPCSPIPRLPSRPGQPTGGIPCILAVNDSAAGRDSSYGRSCRDQVASSQTLAVGVDCLAQILHAIVDGPVLFTVPGTATRNECLCESCDEADVLWQVLAGIRLLALSQTCIEVCIVRRGHIAAVDERCLVLVQYSSC